MKVTRALLLSTKKQAEAREWHEYTTFFSFSGKGRVPVYSYLVTDLSNSGDGIIFDICRITLEKYQDEQGHERTRYKVADAAHVHEEFPDIGELINYLGRYQIDFETIWEPVEEQH